MAPLDVPGLDRHHHCFAAYVAVLLTFLRDERIGHFLLGIPVPFVMILLLLIGLGWLVWFVTARRRPPNSARR